MSPRGSIGPRTSIGRYPMGLILREGQEHVIEAGLLQMEVADLDVGIREDGRWLWLQHRCRPPRAGARFGSVRPARRRSVVRERQQLRARSSASRSWISITRLRPPMSDLSSAEVPSAMTEPWSITTIRSASSSASSRYCVVSSTVVPSATSSRVISQRLSRLAGSSPVVGSSRNRTRGSSHETHCKVRPTTHAARIGAEFTIAGVGQFEPFEQLVRSSGGASLGHAE